MSWNWDEENAHIVVPKSEAIAVYLNHRNQLVIRQQGEIGEDDSMIILPLGFRDALIDAIRDAKPL